MAKYVINIGGNLYRVDGDMETLSGRLKVFEALGINMPTESPTITDNGYTYTYDSEPKAVIGSETLKEQKTNSRKGVDRFIGYNRSARFDKAYGLMGNDWITHPLDFISKDYWTSKTHKAVREGGNMAAAIALAPLATYSAVLAAPFVLNAARVAGQALTPSTWIGGGMLAAGYLAPNWFLNGADLAASAYFANEAGKEIDKNGLTWRTGFNALMSLAPMTRETEAIEGVTNTFRRPAQAISSVVDDFRTARNFVSRDANVPVGSSTTILKNTVEPDWLGDLGRKVPEGWLLPDGTITPLNHGRHRTQYHNLDRYFKEIYLENPVEIDGIKVPVNVFSHNGKDYKIATSSDKSKVVVCTPESSKIFIANPNIIDNPNISVSDKHKELERIKNEAEKYILTSRNNWINSLGDLQLLIVKRSMTATPLNQWDDTRKANASGTLVGDMIEQAALNDITDTYLSDAYIKRFIASLHKNPNNIFNRIAIKKRIKHDLTKLHNQSTPIFYYRDYPNQGLSHSTFNTYGINGNGSRLFDEDWTSTVFHEFGHNLYSSDTPTGQYIAKYNNDLLDQYPLEYINPTHAIPWLTPQYVTYLSDPNEFRQRIMEGVRYGIKEKLTPEEIYDKCDVGGFTALKHYFTKEYLIKMLGLMLGTTPIITNLNKNDKSS